MRAGAVVGMVGVVVLAGCGQGTAGAGRPTVDVSLSHCGQGWTHPTSGQQTFQLRDSDSRAAEVTLVDPRTGGVYAEVEPLAAGRSAAMVVSLGPGSYAFRCALEDEDVVTGPTVVVPAAVEGRRTTATATTPATQPAAAVAVAPVTQQDLLVPTRQYTSYVSGRLPSLLSQVRRLRADLVDGHRAAAQRDWLSAHLAYERLGAAYGAFGDADGAINGLPDGLPNGRQDKGFMGFHRIELGLWSGEALSRLRSPADGLVTQVSRLADHLRDAQVDPLELAVRAHEITENALQLELTGRTDLGSHSALATVRANLDGTATVLRLLDPILRPRYTGLPAATAALASARRDLDALHRASGWPALTGLSRSQRERVDADISQLTELLAPVAAICEPRRTP